MFVAAVALLVLAVPPPVAKPTPELRMTASHELPYGQRLEFRGKFAALTTFLAGLGDTSKPPALSELTLNALPKLNKDGSVELEITMIFVKADPPPAESSIEHPSTHARRLGALSNATPKRTWIKGYAQVDGALAISGGAATPDDIAELMRTLAATPCLFDSLVLTSAERDDSQPATMSFALTARAIDCLPPK